MIVIEKEFFTELHADDGKVITNGDIYSEVICVGKADSVDNWEEVDKPIEE